MALNGFAGRDNNLEKAVKDYQDRITLAMSAGVKLDFSSAKGGKGKYSSDTMLGKAVDHATGTQRLSTDNKDFLEQGLRRLAELAASSAWLAGPEVGPAVGGQLLKWANKVGAAAASSED
jgi:hypothetical protein